MSPRRARFKTTTSTTELRTIPVVAVGVGIMAASVGGLEPWLAGCVMAAVFVGLLSVWFVRKRMAAADLRVRLDIRNREDNRCTRCDADLWGLDVKPGKGRDYVVKCGECGAVNSIAKPKRRKVEKAAKVELEDRGPFKIR